MSTEVLKIDFSYRQQVATLTLNSPQNLNAMDLNMAESFRQARILLQEHSQALRAVVIQGEGRAFSAGGDLEMLRLKAEKSEHQNRVEMLEFYLSFLGLRSLNVPLICLLHGHVVGAGFCFSAACDIRLAADDTKLSAPFTRLALHPGMGGSYFLARSLGSEVARELMLTGRRMGAEEALRHGFVSRVTTSAELREAGRQVTESLLSSAPEATRALLASEREREEETVMATLRREAKEQALCYARPEFLAGIEALRQKAPPPWGVQAKE